VIMASTRAPIASPSSVAQNPKAASTIELHGVCKSYDKFVAVDNLSLAISPGKIYGLLGPNGAGKTSTLRMMIGIIVPDSGHGYPFLESPSSARTWIA
jgi:ABC-type multidrug transport system ATPase subunit